MGNAKGWKHLVDSLQWLDLKIQMLLNKQQLDAPPQDDFMDPFKGLVVSEQEVQRLLLQEPVLLAEPEADVEMQAALAEWEALLARQVAQCRLEQVRLPLPHTADVFALTPFEARCLLACMAVEIDRKYEKLYAFLQDDVTCKHPTVDLVLKLLCDTPAERMEARVALGPDGKLMTYFFKPEESAAAGTWLARPLRLDERLVRFFLHGEDSGRVLPCLDVYGADHEWPALIWEHEVQDRLTGGLPDFFAKNAGESSRNVANPRQWVVRLTGNPGSGKLLQAGHFCRRVGRALVVVDLRRALEEEYAVHEVVAQAVREARLLEGVLCIRHVHLLLEGDLSDRRMYRMLDAIRHAPGLVFLLSEKPWRSSDWSESQVVQSIDLQIPPDDLRRTIWEQLAAGRPFDAGIDWQAVAGKFRFTIGQTRRALEAAEHFARWDRGGTASIDLEAVHKACYLQVQHKLEKKAVRITPRQDFDKLVLPPEQKDLLRNACAQMKFRTQVYGDWGFGRKLSYGKGLSMLFAGPPGTGKTMSAEVIAMELQLEIYKIDLSQIISKYIGETEKNLHEIFAEAQLSSSILFFDEADALFGKRSEVKDSHDKHANVETAYLLQKMEEYEGITILATNFQQNIDEAFMRRLNYVVRFPFPDAQYRELIWRTTFPRETPLGDDVDFPYLAEKFQLAGGSIKNIVMSAAFLAVEAGEPVRMRHLLRAIKHELDKTGKLLLKNELEDYLHELGLN
ncbi:ATP-binding protein [Tumebacillus permanentifrigoris]|uniref:ATPase family protein associated with various cellular activities (AAA) n=1 Tax=Tumebacillus permanentifrigoris TaxID=378543 RepID=A0A316D7H1_9BACL|nr:AAA family ATPase [Tumebacillus permanentifrigoris]PWK11518.1 ATPase family protein associated with various cellular activities (AAA) [Tumebacillus permanentifrigoris]